MIKVLSAVACIGMLTSTMAVADVIYDVAVNTTPLSGQSGYLAFDFLGGSPVENNTVTISGFSTDATLGALTPTGGTAGTISPGPGTLNDSQFFNEFLQTVTSFGTGMSFTLDLTTNASPGGIPDAFAFYLLDSTQTPFPTSDPSGADSLFLITVTGPGLTPAVYTSPDAAATVTPLTVVPEPKSIVPLFLLVATLALTRLRPTIRLLLTSARPY